MKRKQTSAKDWNTPRRRCSERTAERRTRRNSPTSKICRVCFDLNNICAGGRTSGSLGGCREKTGHDYKEETCESTHTQWLTHDGAHGYHFTTTIKSLNLGVCPAQGEQTGVVVVAGKLREWLNIFSCGHGFLYTPTVQVGVSRHNVCMNNYTFKGIRVSEG